MADSPLIVVGAIIEQDGKVLACRRRPDKSAGTLWEFPGGKIEGTESPEEALRREINEELAATIVVGRLASRHVTPLNGRLIDLACYWARLTGPAPISSTDHDQMRWLDRSELFTLEWSPADVPIVRDIALVKTDLS